MSIQSIGILAGLLGLSGLSVDYSYGTKHGETPSDLSRWPVSPLSFEHSLGKLLAFCKVYSE